jgi:hypothetical protein
MGYTHYWYYNAIPRPVFRKILEDFLKLPGWEDELAGGSGSGCPKANSASIIFNGIGERAHETFVIGVKADGNIHRPGDMAFHFCKTARKEYDKYVVACLTIVKHYVGDAIRISSDGNNDEWAEGRNLLKAAGLDYWDSYRLAKRDDDYTLQLVGKVRLVSTKEDTNGKESEGS